MQALIDFEGWRKWRGFIDAPQSTSPSIDSGASPMQVGNHNEFAAQLHPTSPSVSHTTTTATSNPISAVRHHPPKSVLPDAADLTREDSWGSANGDTAESPATNQTTPADLVPAPPPKIEPAS